MDSAGILKGRLLSALLIAVLAVAGIPSLSQASGTQRDIWIATSATEAPLTGRGFGRLEIEGVELVYYSENFEWRLPLAQLKRVAESKQVANAIEIESNDGKVYLVAILTGQLVPGSPTKALQAIQRAVRAVAPGPVSGRPRR